MDEVEKIKNKFPDTNIDNMVESLTSNIISIHDKLFPLIVHKSNFKNQWLNQKIYNYITQGYSI